MKYSLKAVAVVWVFLSQLFTVPILGQGNLPETPDTLRVDIPDEPDVREVARISVAADGSEGNDHSTGFGNSGPPLISHNGQHILFISRATNLGGTLMSAKHF